MDLLSYEGNSDKDSVELGIEMFFALEAALFATNNTKFSYAESVVFIPGKKPLASKSE